MFNTQILDVAIGMIFIYLLLSLVCSAANEVIELWLKNRAADLERGLRELLSDPNGEGLVTQIYSHHLVSGLFEGQYNRRLLGLWNRLLGRVNLPSYIPARNFALALMDLALPGQAGAAGARSGASGAVAPLTAPTVPPVVVNVTPAPGIAAPPPPPPPPNPLDALRNTLQNLPNVEVRQALITLVDAAGNDVAKARQNIEDWYNSSMDRVSGWYKRRSQVIVLVIGLLVTIAMNADSVTIAKKLSSDRALRESLVAAADAYAKANAAASPSPTPAAPASAISPAPKTSPSPRASLTPSASPTPTPSVTPSATPTPRPPRKQSATPTPDPCSEKECEGDADSPKCKLKKSQCAIEVLGLPIGWNTVNDPQSVWPGLHFWEANFWSNWYIQVRLHFLGWLLTGLAVSLGAPFWFDLLNKFIVVRSTVKPKEKSGEEKSKD
jgi:outer membrane biosynthesis protein TonB